jgi:hypothetical protein
MIWVHWLDQVEIKPRVLNSAAAFLIIPRSQRDQHTRAMFCILLQSFRKNAAIHMRHVEINQTDARMERHECFKGGVPIITRQCLKADKLQKHYLGIGNVSIIVYA